MVWSVREGDGGQESVSFHSDIVQYQEFSCAEDVCISPGVFVYDPELCRDSDVSRQPHHGDGYAADQSVAGDRLYIFRCRY